MIKHHIREQGNANMGRKMDEYHDECNLIWVLLNRKSIDRGTAEPPKPAEPEEPVFFYVKKLMI